MEIKKTPPEIAKKLWNLVRIAFYMMRKGISKSRLNMLDLHFLTKQGKIDIGDLMLRFHHHHYSTLSCRSDDVVSSFVPPREYEFSCSNSPAYPYRHPRRKTQHPRPRYVREVDDCMFDIFNHHSEYPVMGLPGLGDSPLVRQLRVTDSPFPANDHIEENHQVDRDAELFIKRFYKDLRNQRRIAAFESPPSYHM